MPNTSVRAAAEGMSDYPRNPHRFAFVRKMLMLWHARAGREPVVSNSVPESFMNQHVDRRAILASSVAAATALAAATTLRQADASETMGAAHQSGAHPDAELFQLEAEMGAATARLKKIERAVARLGKKAEKASGPRPFHPKDWKAPSMPDDLWEMQQAALNQASFADVRDGKKWQPGPLAAWQESVDQKRAMIQAAWDEYGTRRAEAYRLVNYDAKQAEFSAACDEEWQIGKSILAVPAHTLEGIMVKIRTSDRLHLEDFAENEAYVSIAADIRRLEACTCDSPIDRRAQARRLETLIAAHVAALSAYDAVPDEDWKNYDEQIDVAINETRTALFDHRPTTIAEVNRKAQFMASCRTFTEWDDFDRKKLIEALKPA